MSNNARSWIWVIVPWVITIIVVVHNYFIVGWTRQNHKDWAERLQTANPGLVVPSSDDR